MLEQTITKNKGIVNKKVLHLQHFSQQFHNKSVKSNAIDTNYFTTFLQNVDVTNLLLVFI